ncbi:hypothetical protein [Janthinobacterium sp. 1_2014MBL_MicDiv]|uniref:hypothetical protein n=1 Tax=Janthinobacterium sp. 1_2014MBL_MicDiv TaxID=1644131 RepID=UPI0012EC6DB8|nr:hypothetical protein [Janthinobacterium sp. 1_2014MBL_MicDiv]
MYASSEKRLLAVARAGLAGNVFRTGFRVFEQDIIVLEQEKSEFLRIFKPPPWGASGYHMDSN